MVDALRGSEALTRADLVKISGLSRPTIGNAVISLQNRGIVEERLPRAQSRTRAGRPGAVVRLVPHAGVAAGVAIDRDSLKIALVDLAARPVAQHTEPITARARGHTIVVRAAQLIRALANDAGIHLDRLIGVGIGVPGPVDLGRGGVDPVSTLRRWTGLDIRRELSERLDGAVALPDNDANYGALGELHYGSGRGSENLIYVRVGPGVGGGLVLDGRLYRGDRGYAGEIGHIRAVPNGRPCPCGRTGCLSTVASFWAIAERLQPTHGPAVTADQILHLDQAGDFAAQTALREAGAHTGRVLAALVNALNPGLIIVGGTLGARSQTFLQATRDALAPRVQAAHQQALSVVPAQLGDHSEVLGAAARVLSDDHYVKALILAR